MVALSRCAWQMTEEDNKMRLLFGFVLAGVSAAWAQVPSLMGARPQLSGWLTASGVRVNVQLAPVTGKPFSGTEIRNAATTFGDGSKSAVSWTTAICRDAEGRMRMEADPTIVIYDPTVRAWYRLQSDKKTFIKQAIPDDITGFQMIVIKNSTFANSWKANTRPPGTDEDLGSQVINGIGTKGTRIIVSMSASKAGTDHDIQVVNERWYSDALDLIIKSSNNDPRFGLVTYELSNLNLSSPDPTLFKVPPDYQEVQQFNQLGKPPAKQ
jgi:hypothetical protein